VKWLFDTNVVSEGLQRRPDSKVISWIQARAPEQIGISVVTLAELRFGVLNVSNQRRRAEVEDWIERYVASAFEDRILPLTLDILTDWLQLGRRLAAKGKQREPVDVLIASTARIHDLIVVTRNTRHFAQTGVLVYDPWTGNTQQMDNP
jgi:toxin FitB